jgi:hypothetical protein
MNIMIDVLTIIRGYQKFLIVLIQGFYGFVICLGGLENRCLHGIECIDIELGTQ